MAKQKWAEHHFSKRLKAERIDRGWTQAEMAKLLSEKDIHVHWTTIAKIEKGTRSVRIDEAAGIADLLNISVDTLLGRRTEPQSDLAELLRSIKHAAGKSMLDITGMLVLIQGWMNELQELTELQGFEGFGGWRALDAEAATAREALTAAQSALFHMSIFEPTDGERR